MRLLFVFGIVLLSSGGVFSTFVKLTRDEQCPADRPVVDPLDHEKMTGYWYLLFDYQKARKDKPCDCLYYKIGLNDLKENIVQGCCRDFKEKSDVCDSVPEKLNFITTPFHVDDSDHKKGEKVLSFFTQLKKVPPKPFFLDLTSFTAVLSYQFYLIL